MKVIVLAKIGSIEESPFELEIDERFGFDMRAHEILDKLWERNHSHNMELMIPDQIRGADRNYMPSPSERARLQGWESLSYQTLDGTLHCIY